MGSLVDWRTPMNPSSYNAGEINLTHDVGEGITVFYHHDGEINTCGAWTTCSGLNALKEREFAIKWFDWAKTQKDQLKVLESAIAEQYCMGGYSYLAHARLLRAAGRTEEAKSMTLW